MKNSENKNSKENSKTSTGDQNKKNYVSPEIKEHGTLTELTQVGGSMSNDFFGKRS